jgi:hypothetical protein
MSDLAAIKKYLDFPPGRMQQETDYFDALRSIDRFTLEDDELVLWTGAGCSHTLRTCTIDSITQKDFVFT